MADMVDRYGNITSLMSNSGQSYLDSRKDLGESIAQRRAASPRGTTTTTRSNPTSSSISFGSDTDSEVATDRTTEREAARAGIGAGKKDSERVKDLQSMIGFDSKAANKAITMGLTAVNPALGAFYGAATSMLGTAASVAESFEEGFLGDAVGSREHEATRDALEDAGYDRDQSSSAVSGEFDAAGTGGTASEGAATEMGRASGDSGMGSATARETQQGDVAGYGGIASSLGDSASDDGGGGDSGDSGDSDGGHGARGGGNEGTSEAGGIGGY